MTNLITEKVSYEQDRIQRFENVNKMRVSDEELEKMWNEEGH